MGYVPTKESIQVYGTLIDEVVTNNIRNVIVFSGEYSDVNINTRFYDNSFEYVSKYKVGYVWEFQTCKIVTDTARINHYVAKAKQLAYTKTMSVIAGSNIILNEIVYAPDNLSYKDKAKWYESHILGAIKQITDLALQLGENPEKVEKAIVLASQSLAQIATVINPVAGAIAGGVSAIISVLDAFDVFSGSAKNDYMKAKEQYQVNQFVLSRWSEEYAIVVKRWHEVDNVEYQVYLKNLKGLAGLNNDSPKAPTNEAPKANYTTIVAIVIALIFLLFILSRKRYVNT